MTDRVTLSKAWIFEDPEPRLVPFAKESRQLASGGSRITSADDRVSENGLEKPPLDMDSLAALMGTGTGQGNTLHARCVKQKATDTLGRGLTLRAKSDDDGKASSEQEDRWGAFVEQVESDGEGSIKERLSQAHQDFESIGWAVLEVGRNAQGELDGLWHLPAHTLRAHKDRRRFAQKVGDKYSWFKRFGLDGNVDAKRGGWTDSSMAQGVRGNEVIVIRNYTPATTFYGLPDHVPALGALAGWSAQQEFNIRFFGNQAVPSYAVVIEGADITDELEGLILDHFKRIKGDPARTIVIPVPAVQGVGENMQPKVRFERLSVEVKEASFRMYRQDQALEICIAHGVPPYRIGWPIVGSLGGSTAEEMTLIYNDSVVQPRQETWENRLNGTILRALEITDWTLKANELDVRNEARDLEKAKALYELGVTTPNDSARYFGYDPRDANVPGGDDYIAQPLNAAGGGGEQVAKMAPISQGGLDVWSQEVAELAALRKRIEEALVPEPLAAVA